jgi:uncharacterized protein
MPTDPQCVAQGGPVSPCIKVCVLDADGVCTGCLRTLDEIARWTAMSADEQRRVLAELEERRGRMKPGGRESR